MGVSENVRGYEGEGVVSEDGDCLDTLCRLGKR